MSIQEIVTSNIQIHGVASQGWHTVYCEHCGDGSRTKGPRGGWLFNGDTCFYHCFNCGVNGNFDHTREQPYSRDMWDIMSSFGIPKDEVKELIDEYKLENNLTYSEVTKPKVKVKNLKIPKHFYPLSEAKCDNPIFKRAKKFLKTAHMKPSDYPFYLSTGISEDGVRARIVAKALLNRLIIPFFKNGEMVYYQARTLNDNKKKYINAESPRSTIIYGYEQLYTDIDKILFVTEGFFDAFHLNGVSVQENSLSSHQIDILNSSPRRKVIVPDFNGDSFKLAEMGIEQGWGISLPKYHKDCKDVVESIEKNGKLATLKCITDEIYFDHSADINFELFKLKNKKNH